MGRKGLVVIYDDKMLQINKTANAQLRRLYESGSGILLTIGDGDFSFSAALASSFNLKDKEGKTRLLATSYDSQGQVLSKYTSTAGVCLETLKKMDIPVLHNIDGTKLYQTLEVNRYRAMKRPDTLPIPKVVKNCSRVIFNFPNLGNLGADSTFIHQELLKKFLIQCLPLLIRPSLKNDQESGEVHIALRNSPFYEKWDILTIAQSIGYKLHSKEVFHTQNYPGYEEQRTSPSITRAAPPKAEGASIYRFVIDERYYEALQANGFMDVEKIDTTNLNAYTKSLMPEEGDESTWTALGKNPNATTAESSPDQPITDDEFDINDYNIDVFGKLTKKEKAKEKPTSQTGDASAKTTKSQDLTVQLSHNGGLPPITPYQIVSYAIKPELVSKNGKLPVYTALPQNLMKYDPVYPLCPPPPLTTQSGAAAPAIPTLFTHKFHQLLSRASLNSRNFRVASQELKQCVQTWADGAGCSEAVQAQLNEYSAEMLVNGALIIQPIRAPTYEAYYSSSMPKDGSATITTPTTTPTTTDLITDKPAPQIQSEEVSIRGGNRMIKKTVILKKKAKESSSPSKDLDKSKVGSQIATKVVENTTKSKNKSGQKSEAKIDLPQQNRLYIGLIVGILSPPLCTTSLTHFQQSDAAGVAVKKRKADMDAKLALEAADAQKAKDVKKLKNNSYGAELAGEELVELIGGESNQLGLALASTEVTTNYRMSLKERDQIRREKLVKEKLERRAKTQVYQAQRRVQHCEERGKTAKAKDLRLAERAKQAQLEKEQSKADAYARKQDRRIERSKAAPIDDGHLELSD